VARFDRSYGALLAIMAIVLVVGVAVAIRGMATRERPLTELKEGGNVFPVRDPDLIRPDGVALARFAEEDAAWRERYASRAVVAAISRSLATWSPTARQLVADSVFTLVQRENEAEAIRVLERWVAREPADAEMRLELARLLSGDGRIDAASGHYRWILAQQDIPAVRRELAAMLLANAQYEAAQREYRALVDASPGDRELRFGLARALAWSNQWREAERELAIFALELPGDTVVRSMLRMARANIEPSSADARAWMRGDSEYSPYRLELARALVREGQLRLALEHYDTLLASDLSVALLRESAGVHAAIPDSLGAARLLGIAVTLSPLDRELRGEYASALAWSANHTGAIEQLSILLEESRNAEWLFTRGQLHAWAGQYPAAIADLSEAADLAPDYETLALLGDVYRWHGELGLARSTYERALALRAEDPAILQRLAEVRAAELAQRAGASGFVDERGWVVSSRYAEDNAGFLFLSAGISRGFALAPWLTATTAFEQRRISQRVVGDVERWLLGYAASAGAQMDLGRYRVSARGGIMRHPHVEDVPFGDASLSTGFGGARIELEVNRGPAYQMLMTSRTLVHQVAGWLQEPVQLVATAGRGTVEIPVGSARVAVTAEQARFSDGNRRQSLSGAVRLPVARGLDAIYSTGVMGYSDRAEAYWDPERYSSHALGVEYSVSPAAGWVVAARVLPGLGRTDRAAPGIPEGTPAGIGGSNALNLSVGGDVGYHSDAWAVTAGGGYTRGRDGSYQSLSGNLRVQVKW
jgi:Flp pilus assembly protein TadD